MSLFPLSRQAIQPLLPLLGGGVYPSPYPLPWTWTEGAARGWSAQDGPRWLQEGLQCSKMASKMGQGSRRWCKIASDMPPRGPKRATRRPQVLSEPPRGPQRKPKSFQNLRKINDFGLLGGSRGGSESTWGRLVALWGPLGGMSEAILHHLRLSWAILEAILEHWRPFWGHLGPSWRLQPLAAPSVQVQGRG